MGLRANSRKAKDSNIGSLLDELMGDDLFAEKVSVVTVTDAESDEQDITLDATEVESENQEIDEINEIDETVLDLQALDLDESENQEIDEINEIDETAEAKEVVQANDNIIVEAEVKTKAFKQRTKKYTNSKKSEVLLDRIDCADADYDPLIFDERDLLLSQDELKQEKDAFLKLLNTQPHNAKHNDGKSTQKKVAEKVIILLTMLTEKGEWNEVMRRTFKVLIRDGYITAGVNGNLAKELFAKPYSKGTVLAQTGQMMQMLPLLKIATKSEKGSKVIANEHSIILQKIKAEYLDTLN